MPTALITGQHFTDRFFDAECDPADAMQVSTKIHSIATEFAAVALRDLIAQTGETVELPVSSVVVEERDGATHVRVVVVMEEWPEDVFFGDEVLGFFRDNNIEVDD